MRVYGWEAIRAVDGRKDSALSIIDTRVGTMLGDIKEALRTGELKEDQVFLDLPDPDEEHPIQEGRGMLGKIDDLRAERDTALAALREAREGLGRCRELFAEIRGDFTDPRTECREGQYVAKGIIARINRALGEGEEG